MGKTKIEWTEMTWSPVTGCTKVSLGCKNCYAERMSRRLAGRYGYPEAPHHFDVTLHPDKLEQPLHWRKPRMVFVCSMGDLFHEDVPFEFIRDVWIIFARARQHTFQVLTKRPERMLEFVAQAVDFYGEVFKHVWLGVTAENQATADERHEYLRQCPAAVKFVSYEPALSAIDWTGWEFVSLIISGSESGSGARPSHPNWHRATRDFCQEHNIAYFFKQWGTWLGVDYLGSVNAAGIPEWKRADGRIDLIGKPPEVDFGNGHGAISVGKKAAGRLLDGREWNEMPAPRSHDSPLL